MENEAKKEMNVTFLQWRKFPYETRVFFLASINEFHHG